MIFILGVFFGLLIAILLLIGQAVLHKKGITLETPIQKISQKGVVLINPKKDKKIKDAFEKL